MTRTFLRHAIRLLVSLMGVALFTWGGRSLSVNATTIGFVYLLLVLTIATVWGFVEAFVVSIAATLAFNFFYLPPVLTFTIYDPQNYVAMFSFFTTALVASRLSSEAKRRASEAIARQKDVERLYTFSRAILLIDESDQFPKELIRKLAEVFELGAVVLYERRSEEFYRAGPTDFEGLDDQLRDAALLGTTFSDADNSRTIVAVRLGSQPIAGLALQGAPMPDSVLQGVSNLVAIGLERARAQNLAAQVEAAQRSEQLRTSLLDAMAHEFKTPLTSVIGATSALLDNPSQPLESRTELLKIADEEAHHLKELIDDSVEMGRLDTSDIRLNAELNSIEEIIRDVIASTRADGARVELICADSIPLAAVDRRLVKLAIKQLVDNALKYSPPDIPVAVRAQDDDGSLTVTVTDQGEGIPANEQSRIFERLYRSPSVQRQIPGSGLGLSIALSIAHAHGGDLKVASQPGETTFTLTLPLHREVGSK